MSMMPLRPPLTMPEVVELARDMAECADVNIDDELYRRTVLARLAGGADISDLTKYLDD